MHYELSILVPTYNDRCKQLVGELRQQAEAVHLTYEIMVADDGSTDTEVIRENKEICQWEHCRYLQQPKNIGRAAIRNFLAQQAQYDQLLFIDSDMTMIRNDFIVRYLSVGDADVIDGGVAIGGNATLNKNLRYRYEKAAEQEHTAKKRQQKPYSDFHTANFLIRRELMLAHPFDERFRYYGYEDVFFGKQLRTAHIAITHIDNPMGFCTFEDNASFVSKSEEGLRTLHQFQSELQGFSHLLDAVNKLRPWGLLPVIRLWHRLFGNIERRLLIDKPVPLPLFTLYRLGYFLNI